MNMKLIVNSLCSLLIAAGTSAAAQTWGAPQSSSGTAAAPGGVAGRPAISGALLGGKVYAAETLTGTSNQIMIMTNSSPTSTTFANLSVVVLANRGTANQVYALSAVSPALTAMNGRLYLAYTDTGGFNRIISSIDGLNWTGPSANPNGSTGLPTGTQANPSITANPATNTIYTAYTNGQYFTPIVCQWVVTGQPSCQQNYTLDTANFNPSIAFFKGIVYLGYETRSDSHCLLFYKWTPSTGAMNGWTPTQCSEQTSAGPSLVVHNNALYVGFRSNDSSAKFTVRIGSDGNTLPTRQQPGFTMDGYPDLVDVGTGILNIFARYNAVYTTLGQ